MTIRKTQNQEQKEPTISMTQEMLETMMARAAQAGAEAGAKAADKILDERGSRTTRAQELRSSEEVHETYDDLWDEPLLLDATKIPPRPGYTQIWVRTMLDNRPDHGNMAKKLNVGWNPRPVDSAPKGISPPKTSFEDYTNVIGVHGMILMERPVETEERYKRGVRARTKAQMVAVDSDMMRDHEPGKGFGKPSINRKTKVTRGAPRVMEDT